MKNPCNMKISSPEPFTVELEGLKGKLFVSFELYEAEDGKVIENDGVINLAFPNTSGRIKLVGKGPIYLDKNE